MIQRIDLKLGKRSYPLFIQKGVLSRCGEFLRKTTASKRVAVLSTPKIYRLYGKNVSKSLQKSHFEFHPILIDDGEKYKNETTLFRILRQMADHGFQRDGCLLALGGGVVGDLGGLAASLYMRGIGFIQCPTTLLAQVDASVGGKTAIDFAGIKNLVGAFYQPQCVLIDPDTLGTLSDRQFKTGLAEVIKYGVIQDKTLFERMEKNIEPVLEREGGILEWLIYRSCALKAQIVSQDERESGKRAWLNYGHTLGHALEAYFHYGVLTHGEAIAYGMWFAAMVSRQVGLCNDEVVTRQRKLLARAGLFRGLPRFRPEEIYQKMRLDKKAREGRVQFVLTRKIGLVTIQKNIPRTTILAALTQLQSESSERR